MTTVVTINTKRGHARVVDFEAVALRQELNSKDSRDEVQRSLPLHDHYIPSPTWAKRLMISWPTDQWTLVPSADWLPSGLPASMVDKRGASWKAHGGLGKVSPARGVIGVCLEHTSGLRVVFLNTHFVSSAWSGRKLPQKAWRKRKWLKHKAMLNEITQGLTTAGHMVVVGGDMNRGITIELPGLVNPRETKPAGIEAYDQLLASPDLDPRDFRRAGEKAGSDHYPQAIDIGQGEIVPDITDRFEQALRDEGANVLSRAQWGTKSEATYQTRRRTKPHRLLPDKPSDTLVQHVTVTKPTDSPAADMRGLEAIGNARFGSGVSYNVVVHPNGTIMLGQPLDAKGTHTVNDKGVPGFSRDQNYVALAVAWIGLVGDKPTPEAEAAIVDVIRALIKIGGLTKGFDYVPHSMFAFKDCPLQSMRDRMPAIRDAGTDQPPKPNKVQRAQVQAEELAKTVNRAMREAQSIADLLADVPEKRTAVANWATELEKTAAELKKVRIDVRGDADKAPEK